MGPRLAWWVGAAGVGLLFLAVSLQKIWAGDFWGQLATGQWILEHWRLPRQDSWTFTRAGTAVTEVRWLYCVAIALGWKAGAWLLCLGQLAGLGAMWAAVVCGARRAGVWTGWKRGVGLVILALGISAGAGRWVLRPELVTDCMIAAYLVVLEGVRRGSRADGGTMWRWRRAWWLVLAQAVWVNSHSLYVFGPIIVGAFVGEAVIASIRSRDWRGIAAPLGVTFAVAAACFVTPYGVRGGLYALEMWRESRSAVGESLGEMRSPLRMPAAMWTWDLWAAAVMGVAGAGTFAANWRKCGLARAGLFVMALSLAATAQRNAAILAVIGAWAGLMNVGEGARQRHSDTARRGEEEGRAESEWRIANGERGAAAAMGVWGLACAGVGWWVMTDRSAIGMGAPKEFGVGVVEWDVPRDAADFVAEQGLGARVFNTMREGHYLTWRSGGRIKVFVDGRTDVIGDALLKEYEGIGPRNWEQVTGRWGIDTAIVPVRGYEDLVAYLGASKGWALVYLDHHDVVFVRDTQANSVVIARHRIDVQKPWIGAAPEQKPEGWKRALGGPGRPWYTMGMAGAFVSLSAWENAAEFLNRTLAEYPGYPRARAELAAIDRFAGKTADGDRLATGLKAEWAEVSDRMLASMLTVAGRFGEAQAALERGVQAGGRDASLRVALADVYFQKGEFAKAKAQYEAAVALGHDEAAEWVKLGSTCEREKDLEGAARAYRRGLIRDATQYQAWNRLGMVLGQRGDKAGAIAAFERALAIHPGFEAAKKNLEMARGMR